MDVFEQLEKNLGDLLAHLEVPIPGMDHYAERDAFMRKRNEIIVSMKQTLSWAQSAAKWDAETIAALRGVTVDPRAALLDDLCAHLDKLNDPQASMSSAYYSNSLERRNAVALEAAHRALGPAGFTFVHILVSWLRAQQHDDSAARDQLGDAERSNLERDDARRGWAIAKAGSAERDAVWPAAVELFGAEEAKRLFPTEPAREVPTPDPRGPSPAGWPRGWCPKHPRCRYTDGHGGDCRPDALNVGDVVRSVDLGIVRIEEILGSTTRVRCRDADAVHIVRTELLPRHPIDRAE